MKRLIFLTVILIIFFIIPLGVFLHSFHLPLYGEIVGDYLILLSSVLAILKEGANG